MGSISSRTCRTCKYNIRGAGIFAGKINCDYCARIARTPKPLAYHCSYCRKVEKLDYEPETEGFFLCKECSGRAQSYLDNENYSGLEIMATAVKSNGGTVPQYYLDALERAQKGDQRTTKSTSCDHCGRLVRVPYHFEARERFRCATLCRNYTRRRIENEMQHSRREITGDNRGIEDPD